MVVACGACASLLGLDDVAYVPPRSDAALEGSTPITDGGPADAPPPDGGGDGSNECTSTSDAGLGYLLVFVTSTKHVGQFPPADGGTLLNGLSGADEFCRSLADALGSACVVRGRRWAAWLSWRADGTGDARSRLGLRAAAKADAGDGGDDSGDAGPATTLASEYRLVDGVTRVFPAGFDFAASGATPENPIQVDERLRVVSTATLADAVWTGTRNDGTASGSTSICGGWNPSAPDAEVGTVGLQNETARWSTANTLNCNAEQRIYCFEVTGK
jgi:hypothetical protein